MSNDDREIPEELITVRDFLRWAVSRFNESKLSFGHGTQDAYDEAAYLVLHTLHLPLDRLEPFLDAALTAPEREALFGMIDRRIRERVPAAYLTHEAWLGDFRFYVDERVIVPRSFIAELLEQQLAPWISEPQRVERVLDLCTGSGCLAIVAAHAFPRARVDAVDISADALAVARRNVDDYGLQERIELVRSDLFSAIQGREYDLIISNPPYVTAEAMGRLPLEYRHEPELALGAGEQGLDVIRRILAEAHRFLKAGGLLLVEAGHNRAIVEAAYPGTEFVWLDAGHSEDRVFVLPRTQLPAT